MLAFLVQHVPANTSPLCGNSVHQDRRFLVKYLPRLEAFLLYRNLDVSTLKELVRRWKPDVMAGLTKHGKHEALADIHESIAELRYYREHILKI
jgi:oligoribonuclease